MSEHFRLRNTIKYPTSLIINGASPLGLEIANSLLEQGGYVVLVDIYDEAKVREVDERLGAGSLYTLLDYTAIPHLEDELRRLDYVFYLQHEYRDLTADVSTQDFLKYSNYLDSTLSLALKFEAKYVLTTSMSAHQLYMTSSLDVDGQNLRQVDKKLSTYNEMELQRYAESLTLEYVSKANLNARIIRLGEVVGNKIDFSKHTSFNTLVMAAAAGDKLYLAGDGLDAEWYVHLLDAAYAVVKAQFTRDTVGNIYSVSYETGVTALSIAYKLQDIEPLAKEIEFDRNSLATTAKLRLNKPAPSLGQIGWKPSISFEQALKESLAAAKTFLITAPQDVLNAILPEQNNVLGKLRSFFNMAQAEEAKPVDGEDSGPVSRLIEQRKRQQEERAEAVYNANTYLRQRTTKRERGFWEGLEYGMWKRLQIVGERFNFLRTISPAEFVFYSAVIVIGIFIYLTIISPGAVFLRNTLIINDNIAKLTAAANNNQMQESLAAVQVLSNATEENSTILKNFAPTANVLALGAYYDRIQQTVAAYAELTSGIEYLSQATAPLDEYLQDYVNNLRFRPSAESYLAVGASTNHSELLAKMAANPAIVEAAVTQISAAQRKLSEINLTILPAFIESHFRDMNQKILVSSQKILSMADLATYAPELLGSGGARNYLVVLLDNARPMPLGGTISAYGMFTMQNGSFSNAVVQSIDAFSPGNFTMPNFLVQEVNRHRFTASNTVSIADLAYIDDVDIFREAAQRVWGDPTNVQLDGVVLINLNTLSNWIDQAGGIELEQEQITSQTILRSLQRLQSSNETAQRRNDLLAQLFAKLVDTSLQQYPAGFYKAAQALANSATTGDLIISSTDLQYNKLVEKYNLNAAAINESDMGIKVGFVADQRVVSPERFAAATISAVMQMRADNSLQVSTYYIKFPNVANLDFVSVCLPSSAKNFKISNFPAERVKANISGNQNCLIADVVTETDLNLSWDTLPFESLETNEYNLRVGIGKPDGVSTTADLELTIPSELELLEIEPEVPIQDGQIAFKQTILKDELILLKFRRR